MSVSLKESVMSRKSLVCSLKISAGNCRRHVNYTVTAVYVAAVLLHLSFLVLCFPRSV